MGNENIADKKFQKEINSGTAALVLLATLSQSIDQMYGYQIAKHLEKDRDEIPMIKQGALYPVLRSLENSGLLQSLVEPSVSGPPRKYYKITEKGKETLLRWNDIWEQTKSFVDSIIEGGKND
ncbi:MAG: PadR family transcriptional regulator [Planctomycetia bacterium]|nr:PadR family transcriptional regulator [Planctomycetia bacterium]